MIPLFPLFPLIDETKQARFSYLVADGGKIFIKWLFEIVAI